MTNGAYERSELAQSYLAVLVGTGAPATSRRLRTRAAAWEQKGEKDGTNARPQRGESRGKDCEFFAGFGYDLGAHPACSIGGESTIWKEGAERRR